MRIRATRMPMVTPAWMIRRTRWARLIRKSWSESRTGGWAADGSSPIRFYTLAAVADVIDLVRQQRQGGVPDRPRTGVGPDDRVEGDDLAAGDVAGLAEACLQGAAELLGVGVEDQDPGPAGEVARRLLQSGEHPGRGAGEGHASGLAVAQPEDRAHVEAVRDPRQKGVDPAASSHELEGLQGAEHPHLADGALG